VPPGLRSRFEPIAVADDRGVAHWGISFEGDGGGLVELDGILVCTFDGEGRCTLHREWYERRERGRSADPRRIEPASSGSRFHSRSRARTP
jgi:hypothetical protein